MSLSQTRREPCPEGGGHMILNTTTYKNWIMTYKNRITNAKKYPCLSPICLWTSHPSQFVHLFLHLLTLCLPPQHPEVHYALY